MTKTIESAASLVLLALMLAIVIVAVRPAPRAQLHCHDGSCHAHR